MTQFTRVVNGRTELTASLFNDLQEAIEQQSFNVMRYGAKGDGVTDDTAAIQAAIDAAVSNQIALGELYFPPGEYRISDTLTVSYRHGFRLRGIDPQSTIIRQYTDNTPILRLISDPFAHHTTIEGITLGHATQQSPSDTSGIGIELWADASAQTFALLFDRLSFHQCRYGIKGTDTHVIPFVVTVSNCFFGSQSGEAIYIHSSSGKPAWILDQIYVDPVSGDDAPTTDAFYFSGCSISSRNVTIDSWPCRVLYKAGSTAPCQLDNWHLEGGVQSTTSGARNLMFIANGGAIIQQLRVETTIDQDKDFFLVEGYGNDGSMIVMDGVVSSAHIDAGAFYPLRLSNGAVGYTRNIHGEWTDNPIKQSHATSLSGIRAVDHYHYLPTSDGAPTDDDVPAAKDGVQILDTTNDRLYIRSGGAWVYTELT